MKITQLATAGLALASLLWMSNLTGALPGNTGAPGEFTCGRAPCHNIPANVGDAQIAIVVDDSATAYQPGAVHTLTISVEGAQSPRNGFQVLALNENNLNVGEWIITAPELMKIIEGFNSPRKYVTHNAAGNQQSSWAVNWEAPAEGAGAVTFYASVLDANNNGANTGDAVYTTSNTLTPEVASTISPQAEPLNFILFPNPATEAFHISIATDQAVTASLFNSAGQLAGRWTNVSEGYRFDTGGLPEGLYILQLQAEGGVGAKKVLVKRP